MTYKKKLIEVALPLEAINKAAAHEKMPGIGPHPRGLHLWWARRPLAAARAVIFAQMVDDPSEHPDIFKTQKAQVKERERLFKIIEDLVKWENSTNQELIERAKEEIWQSWRYTCAENADNKNAKELFDRFDLPGFHDPFSGGGAIPLEAQRLGLKSYAGDLNPVAILINKSMIEIPPRFSNLTPVNPAIAKFKDLVGRDWKLTQGLAEDVKLYGEILLNKVCKKIGHTYPKYEITSELIDKRADLEKYSGRKLNPIAWVWVRTVLSPNPAFSTIHVPLASTFTLSNKDGKEIYIEPLIEDDGYSFAVKVGKPNDTASAKNGTKLARGANFKCLMSGAPISGDYIKAEGKAGRFGVRLMSVVCEGDRARVYLPANPEQEAAARVAKPDWLPDLTISGSTQYLGVKPYGMETFDQLFTNRQLNTLTTFADLIAETHAEILKDCEGKDFKIDPNSLEDGGCGAKAYADAVCLYLAFAIDRCCDFSNSCTRWVAGNQKVMNLFGKQAIGMTWDFSEAAILNRTVGGFGPAVEFISECIKKLPGAGWGEAVQQDAATSKMAANKVISTDPPYYDNVPYADLSDFFYVWLRKSLRPIFPKLLSTVAVPKLEELVAFAYRHSGKSGAEAFFLNGMTQAMTRLSENAHPAFPITIYYAFKQSESDGEDGTANTGWETFLDAVVRAGFSTTGTWPMRSEQEFRMRSIGSNALASSIVLVCRKKNPNAVVVSRREFLATLKAELPAALAHLQAGNIAPVDLAQAAIGPGMAVYTRYAKVIDAEGKALTVREALALINQTLDEALAEQEGDFDADTRWALTWFEQVGFSEGDYGLAEQLSKSKNTAITGLVEGGILLSKAGKVRLLKPGELFGDWDPISDRRLTVWETVHQLIRLLESGGEVAVSVIVARLGNRAEIARELCYRLYTLCERKKRSIEAMAYNGLVQSWSEITRLANEMPAARTASSADMFEQE
jgi:putative DNA methylase